MDENCIFCKIIKGEIPSYKIYEDEYTYAFLDIASDAEGHTLVIPKKHCVNILDCDKETLTHVYASVQKIANHYVNNCGYDGVNTINANGKAAQQSVFHYHVHIIPRKDNDNIDAWPFKDKLDINMEDVQNKLKIN